MIILESFLSFLGLGIQPPTPAWGNMLGEGRVYMLNSWWIATFPGLAIFVTTLAINLMGNAPAGLARPPHEAVDEPRGRDGARGNAAPVGIRRPDRCIPQQRGSRKKRDTRKEDRCGRSWR